MIISIKTDLYRMKNLIQFKEYAQSVFGLEYNTFNSYSDPISFLYSLLWNVPSGGAFSETVLSEMNINLDERGCFGRAVKGAVLSERYFSHHTLYAGEVCNDLLRSWLLSQATTENWDDVTFIAELLQYENPHIVLIDSKGKQFDPVFKELTPSPEDLQHPNVLKHTIWEGLHAAYLVSEAIVKRDKNVNDFISILEYAHELYPDVILVKENLASAYYLINKDSKAIALAKEVSVARRDAKTLLFLFFLTSDVAYKHQITEQYNVKLFDYLIKSIKE